MQKRLFITAFALTVSAGCANKAKVESAAEAAKNSTATTATASTAAKVEAAGKSAAADAKAQAATLGSKLECATKADKRLLEIRSKDKGCELAYTKNGQESVVASAKNGMNHCVATLSKMKETLATSGYACK
jgi:hypothetical protein